ncbi:hypothetical protein [Methanimicrococcus blatticola]|uniref:Uncharacterized protein n=1 Tax=Methanimicrococcus blatticola TaxID=91560 RepID=A0A484F2V1_9EURY|nr:hypothetical protein [Methanimicrococcus blatticola]MBZ3935388.1 hypothetical protein [Methanimicrococcus blatticola]MCC2508514.1 hypothetical protein [Methanimicrococcus blatticola]TDQ67824.1 hypothetical protein C7391_1377 [Methanimicrococcus blatticola]
MAGYFNQSEKVNNIVFIGTFLLYALSAYIYSKIYFLATPFPSFVKILGIGYFAAFVIFGPFLYGLFSQNLNKSKLFGILTSFSFLWMVFSGFHVMAVYSQFYFKFHTMVGTHLFAFVTFLILGYFSAIAGAVWHEDSGTIRIFSKQIPVSSTVLYSFLALSIVFFIIWTFPAWTSF